MKAIQLQQVTKVYRIYQGSRGFLKEIVFRKPFHRPFWALKQVSLDVDKGTAFGIIGDNGAGKSTLLKIICGTTVPTSGRSVTQGRVGSLLELGIGFHPELTARENILFSAAVAGVERDAARVFAPEIIRFAELDDFADQPVRTYSSGMYVRLGFAVATAFDPDILVVDEALAVGDQNFQARCIQRMNEFRRSGKTIIVCSHNLYQISELCDRAIWLHRGESRALGTAAEVVEHYCEFLRSEGGQRELKSGNGISAIRKVALTDASGKPCAEFQTGEALRLVIEALFPADFVPNIGVGVIRDDGLICYCAITKEDLFDLNPSDGIQKIVLELPDLQLLSGRYHFSVATTDDNVLQAYEVVEPVCHFEMKHSGTDYGLVRMSHTWK